MNFPQITTLGMCFVLVVGSAGYAHCFVMGFRSDFAKKKRQRVLQQVFDGETWTGGEQQEPQEPQHTDENPLPPSTPPARPPLLLALTPDLSDFSPRFEEVPLRLTRLKPPTRQIGGLYHKFCFQEPTVCANTKHKDTCAHTLRIPMQAQTPARAGTLAATSHGPDDGLLVPRPKRVEGVSIEERSLVWTLVLGSGCILLRTSGCILLSATVALLPWLQPKRVQTAPRCRSGKREVEKGRLVHRPVVLTCCWYLNLESEQPDSFGRTLCMCSGGWVLVTMRHGVVRVRSCTVTVIGHAVRSSCPGLPLVPVWLSALLYFAPSPSLARLNQGYDRPTELGSFCFGLSAGCCCSHRADTV